MNKYERYRRKCISEGRCPHCGKQCAPYLECDERRTRKRLLRAISRAIKAGAVEKLPGGKYRIKADAVWPSTKVSGRKGDRRLLPTIANRPTTTSPIIRSLALVIAKENGGVVTEEQIAKAFGDLRIRHSKRLSSPSGD